MAISQEQVDAWFAANPNATPDDVAKAVQSIGGLEANQGLAGMIANRFSIAEPEVTNYYNAFTAPASGGISNLDVVQPTKAAVAPTSGAVSKVIEGDDIDTQIAQLPEQAAYWTRSADQRSMELIDNKTGQVLDRRSVGDFSDLDLVKMGLSMVPGAGQVLSAVNIADAVRTGDLTKAAIGATGLVPGMQNVNTALRVGQAVDSGNTLGALSALAGNADVKSLTGLDNLSVGDNSVSLNDIMKGVGTAQALSSGNPIAVMKALSSLSDMGGNLKSSLAGFEANPEDFIEGYFQPGGEGYLDLGSQDMTVREEPENLDALLRLLSPYQVDGGTSIFVQPEDIPEFETVDKRPVTSLADLFGDTDIMQTVDADVPELFVKDSRPKTDVPEMVITDDRPTTERPSIYTKEIKSDIPDEITVNQIDKLFPNIDYNDILQTVTSGGTKTTTPTKTTTKTPGTTTTEQALVNLGLNAPMPSQDPYANIKLMEELFGGDTAYKLRALGAPKNLASADLDALARLLRG